MSLYVWAMYGHKLTDLKIQIKVYACDSRVDSRLYC